MMRYGRGRVRLLRKHPDTFSLLSFLPALFVAGVILGPVCGLLFPTLLLAYVAILGGYGLTVFGFGLAAALRGRDAALLPWLVAVYPAIHFGAGIGVLWEALSCRLRLSRRLS